MKCSVNRFDRNSKVFSDSFEDRIEINTMCSWSVAHIWASSFDGHSDDGIVVFIDDKRGCPFRAWQGARYVIDRGKVVIQRTTIL